MKHDFTSSGKSLDRIGDGAALKLKHYRLEHHFRFGGYGDDHHERDDVARVAFREAVRHLRRGITILSCFAGRVGHRAVASSSVPYETAGGSILGHCSRLRALRASWVHIDWA